MLHVFKSDDCIFSSSWSFVAENPPQKLEGKIRHKLEGENSPKIKGGKSAAKLEGKNPLH